MFCRILRALNFYWVSSMKETNVPIRPFDNFMMIGNQPFFVSHKHDGPLACWMIHKILDNFDKSRSLQAHSE